MISWMQTYTGKQFDLVDIQIDLIDIQDIAHSLSLICRYNGHCLKFYSVAQHSVLCSRMVRGRNNKLWCLLHDAAEAYIGDITRPVKQIYPVKNLEDKILEKIAEKFALPFPMPSLIKHIDNTMLATEAPQLMAPSEDWGLVMEPVKMKITPWSPKIAKKTFLKVYNELVGG